MRTAIYARFSSQLQKDSSIEDQVRVCTERARREGWTITEIFTDYAISGAVRDRPGLNALVDHIRAGHADQVMAEALDRLSRHQGDMAWLHERIIHAGARIFTLSEGPIDELQIGFKGTMAALFRKDLADKIRRGQTGRVAAGRTPGNVVYGYRKVHRLDARGEAERGLREIDPGQAEIVRRIYREYLAGDSPLAIARRLNEEGVPAPAGGRWQVSAINGDTVRGNGILCNEIYVGVLVYNRTTMMRDPETRRRVPRVNPPEQWQRESVPHLRIIDDESWARVRALKSNKANWDFKAQKRPKRLLSGLIACGVCGGPFVVVGSDKWGCATSRRAGTCDNHRKIDTPVLERRVLAGLRQELLSPERISLAVRAYHQERQRLDRQSADLATRNRRRIDELGTKIDRLVAAIGAGAGSIAEVVEALQAARAEREQLQAALDELQADQVIRLHPMIAEAYRVAIETIMTTLDGSQDDARDARNAIRALIDRVILTPKPEGRGLDIDLEGRLNTMLQIANGRKPQNPEGMFQVVAEEGLEPPTRGL